MSFAEFLVEMFGIERERAQTVAQVIVEDEFLKNHSQLEILLGLDNAGAIIREGDVVSYAGTVFAEYLPLAREVYGKMGSVIDEAEISVFYATEALRIYLEGRKEEGIDFSKVEFFRYHLFNPENEQSARYLNALIEDGKVQVGTREHWMRTGRKLKGAKGLHILTNITAQVSKVCDAIGVPRPNYTVNGGQLSLSIKNETRELLRTIRDGAYERATTH